jgi:hypothetical protein
MNTNSIPQKLPTYDDIQYLQEFQRQKKCQICGHVGNDVSSWFRHIGGDGGQTYGENCDNAEDCKKRLEAGK